MDVEDDWFFLNTPKAVDAAIYSKGLHSNVTPPSNSNGESFWRHSSDAQLGWVYPSTSTVTKIVPGQTAAHTCFARSCWKKLRFHVCLPSFRKNKSLHSAKLQPLPESSKRRDALQEYFHSGLCHLHGKTLLFRESYLPLDGKFA